MRWFVVFVLFLGWSTSAFTSQAWAQDAPGAPAAETEAACVGCGGAQTVACATCKGTGKGKPRCGLCDGTGRYACPDRTDLREEVSFFARILGRDHEGTERACPNDLCHEGKVTWDDGKSYACKPCGGRGDVRCATCKLTQRPCPKCNGKRRVPGVCTDCTGKGKLACAVCRDPAQPCRQCDGRTRLPCKTCAETGRVAAPCFLCSGRGSSVCTTCSGTSKRPCSSCVGTGRFRTKYTDGTTASSSKCSACGSRGYTDCSQCEKGLAKCDECKGKGDRSRDCIECEGKMTAPCTLCGELGHVGAVVQADVLDAAGHPDVALRLYEGALVSARNGLTKLEERMMAETKKPLSTSKSPGGPPRDPASARAALAEIERILDELRRRLDVILTLAFRGTALAEDIDAIKARIAELREKTTVK